MSGSVRMGGRTPGWGSPPWLSWTTRFDIFWITTSLVLLLVPEVTSGEQSTCRKALGMQSGDVPDGAIAASSAYDTASVGPQNARIRTERNGGAWCPKEQISREVYEWLEVDFGNLTMVSAVETQGRFGNGQGLEFAEAYRLQYQREEGGQWHNYRNRTKEEVFKGNTNTYTAVLRDIVPPIIARKIRVVPFSAYPRTVCMRIEVYGCPWTVGIVSYSMPQGERRGAEVDLYDFTYDGQVSDALLQGGLGQLTDAEEGQSNFRLDPGVGRRGYEWVGWKNDTENRPPIVIVFTFDVVRNFTAARFHCNNLFSKDVRAFRMARLYFSVGGRYYQHEVVVYEFMRDTLIEFARQVIIPIPHRVAKYVKVELYFDARWLMLSEVKFDSVAASGNYSEELPHLLEDGSIDNRATVPDFVEVPPGGDPPPEVDGGWTTRSDGEQDSGSNKPKTLDDQFIGIIIGALAALLLILAAIVIFVVLRHRKRKCANSKVIKTPTATQHVTLNLNDLRALSNGNSNYANANVSVNESNATAETSVANETQPSQPNGNGGNGGKVVSNGNVYNRIATSDVDSDRDSLALAKGKPVNGDLYREPFDQIQTRKLPDLPPYKTPESTDTEARGDYAVPDMTQAGLFVNGATPTPTPFPAGTFDGESPPPPPLPPHPSVLYGDVDSLGLQGFSGNSLYAVPNNLDLLWTDDFSVMEFARENLKFVEKLGEGQFGEVHLCEACRITDFLGDDFLVNRTGASRSMLVAVKTLRHNADDVARGDFHKEVKIMSRLKDPNIVRVLGVCTQEEPLCVVVEYMKYGDLHQFLRQHVPLESTMARNKNVLALSYGCLIYMANQIASGMKYLETLNMVHRDLATRNCLVGHFYQIKISDFGMSRSLYSSDYYRIEGKAVLPIRWMAWESVLLGKFSTKSDVWSFAVTLWEVLTFAREQPYDVMSDEQVIENCGHYYRDDHEEVSLPQPANCPREIYDLMLECWNRDEVMRPAFREIHMFMQRKNMGYSPQEERQVTPTTRGGVAIV